MIIPLGRYSACPSPSEYFQSCQSDLMTFSTSQNLSYSPSHPFNLLNHYSSTKHIPISQIYKSHLLQSQIFNWSSISSLYLKICPLLEVSGSSVEVILMKTSLIVTNGSCTKLYYCQDSGKTRWGIRSQVNILEKFIKQKTNFK